MAKRKQTESTPSSTPSDTSLRAEMDRRLERGDNGGALKLAKSVLKSPPDPETEARAKEIVRITGIDMVPVWVLVGMLVLVGGVFVNNILVRNAALATTVSPVEVEKSVVKRAQPPVAPASAPVVDAGVAPQGGADVPPG